MQCCQDKLAAERREDLHDKLQQDLERLQTHPDITTIILRAVMLGQNEPLMLDLGGHESETQFQHAMNSQNNIGWDKLRLGFWAKEWCVLQQGYYNCRGLNQHGSTWAAIAQEAVWCYIQGNWEYRNKRVHGDTDDEKRKILHNNMAKEIETLFARSTEVGASGRHLFERKERLLRRTLRRQRNWLKSVRTELDKEHKRCKDEWREKSKQQRLDQLLEIRQQAPRVAGRKQQALVQYFRLPEPIHNIGTVEEEDVEKENDNEYETK